MRIIVGSSSPRRKEIVTRVAPPGSVIESMTPDVDEKDPRYRRCSPYELTAKLAMVKSEALRPRITDPAVLITADTVVLCQGKLREKPETLQEARDFLVSYQKFPAVAVTSMVVYHTGTKSEVLFIDTASIKFKKLTDELIEAIVQDGAVFNAAGAFLTEHPLFAGTIDWVDGDIETIQGLPGRFVGLAIDQVSSE